MAALDYPRRRKLKIIAVTLLLLVSVFVLSACNANNGVYNVDGDISEPTHFMAKFMLTLNDGIGNFGWTVVVFTIILRLILSPLDFWQKLNTRKNAKAMERMKPQLEALQERYKNDKERQQQEQMALYKKEKYSMMGMCLPTILTMVVFFVVFAGFTQMVGYQYALDYKASAVVFDQSMTEQLGEDYEQLKGTEGKADEYAAAIEVAQEKVRESYVAGADKRGFLWIKNIFVADTWKQAVPDYLTVTGQSGYAMSRLNGVTADEYNTVMGKVLGTGGWGANGSWNGLLTLPILSIALSFLSSKLMTASQGMPPQAKKEDKDGKGKDKKGDGMQSSMKMMQYMMPVMMGVFGLLYSGAFALYMFTSSLSAILFQLGFNVVAKIVDASRDKKAGISPRKVK